MPETSSSPQPRLLLNPGWWQGLPGRDPLDEWDYSLINDPCLTGDHLDGCSDAANLVGYDGYCSCNTEPCLI